MYVCILRRKGEKTNITYGNLPHLLHVTTIAVNNESDV